MLEELEGIESIANIQSAKITQRIQKEDMKTIREREEILTTYQRGTSME